MTDPSDVVVVAGVRTPFVRSGTAFRGVHPAELGRIVAREAVERAEIDPAELDEVIVGNTAATAGFANIARMIQFRTGIPEQVSSFTVNRNRVSGLQCLVDAAYRIRAGHADLVLAVAVESISSEPHDRQADPVFGVSEGGTAENLAREFGIGREEQDRFALGSHQKATAAWAEGKMDAEVLPVPLKPEYMKVADRDDGVRESRSMDTLAKMRPLYDSRYGTVTGGNGSSVADGAVALVLASRRCAGERMLGNLGTIRSWGFAGSDRSRIGLGPVLATPRALARAGNLSLSRIGLVEIHEAFSAQVLACLQAFGSRTFSRESMDAEPAGDIDPSRLNVNGGALALGDAMSASGARLVLTLLHEMARRDQVLGLATLCAEDGQGAAVVLERS